MAVLSPQAQACQAEKQIKAEFERLHVVLYTEEVSRLKALADEEEEKVGILKEKMDRLTKDIITINGLIETVKREMGAEDLPFLKVTVLCQGAFPPF